MEYKTGTAREERKEVRKKEEAQEEGTCKGERRRKARGREKEIFTSLAYKQIYPTTYTGVDQSFKLW